MSYNLASPGQIKIQPDLKNLREWVISELIDVPDPERELLHLVLSDLHHFARWPKEALLFFPGAVRTSKTYHRYPSDLRSTYRARTQRHLDTRPNGPAIAAFIYAGGVRPVRHGSTNEWGIHHIYNGKFPYPGNSDTLHAVKHGEHFSNSAGLIAVHPILDAMADEYPALTWLLRAEAFQRFGYDPDCVFRKP